MFTDTLHHITNAASSTTTIQEKNRHDFKNHSLFTQNSNDNFKEVT